MRGQRGSRDGTTDERKVEKGESDRRTSQIVAAAVALTQSTSAEWSFTRPLVPPSSIRTIVCSCPRLPPQTSSPTSIPGSTSPPQVSRAHQRHLEPPSPPNQVPASSTETANLPYCLCPSLVFGVFCELDLKDNVDRCRRRAGLQRCGCFRIGELD